VSTLGVSRYPYQVRRPVGRPSQVLIVGSTHWLAKKYGVSFSKARRSRQLLMRLNLMKPEARRYMLKLVRGSK
jgi:hypothetical protein